MISSGEANQPWWSLLFVLLEKAVTTWDKAIAVFISLALAFSLPLLVYDLIPVAWNAWLSIFLSCIMYVLAIVFTSAGATYAVGRLRDGRKPTVGETFSAVFSNFVPLVFTSVVGGLAEALGLCALLVPGIFVLMWILFAGPAVMCERLRGWPAIQRGRAMVGDGRWIWALTVLALAGATRLLFAMIPQVGMNLYEHLAHEPGSWQGMLVNVWAAGLDLFMMSLLAVWVGSAWFDAQDIMAAAEAEREAARKEIEARAAAKRSSSRTGDGPRG